MDEPEQCSRAERDQQGQAEMPVVPADSEEEDARPQRVTLHPKAKSPQTCSDH
jgi:hypothetical protein